MTRLLVPIGPDDHVQGPEDAPVTLVEYGDYQCPYCGEAYPVLKAVQERLGARLRFVFRNFPISGIHPHAVPAARLAEAAGAIGRFWEAHDLLYAHQEALGDRDLHAYGTRLGLDGEALRAAFAGRFDQKIQGDFVGGVRSGVNGTPTLFINGQRYDGARDVETLVTVLTRVMAA